MGNHDEYDSALLVSRAEPPDLETAYNLLVSAANQGDDRAIYAIATWYMHGNAVVERDEVRGVSMLKELENSNVAEAVFDLAVSYDLGMYVEKDEKRAFSLYMRAALLGDISACQQISQFYSEGAVVDHDDALAKAWLKRSECQVEDISPSYRLWLEDQRSLAARGAQHELR